MFGSADKRARILLIAALIAGAHVSAFAQTPQSAREVEKTERERELEILKGDLERAEAINAKLKAEIDSIKNDRKQLAQSLTDTAARIRVIEANLDAGEKKLAPLIQRETDVRASLGSRRAVLAEILAALQRMGRNPPPAILMHPDDALGAVRAAILLGAVLPELRTEAETLAAELGELARLRSEIAAERETLRAVRAELEIEQRRISALVGERQRALKHNEEALAAERTRMLALSKQTESVRELVARMEREIAAAARAASAADRPAKIDPTLALADPTRTEPAIPFARARGRLLRPVSGSLLREYGPSDDPNGQSQGISIATRAGSPVIAPCDGWVVFAGPFRTFGNLLILNAGGGYHVLLAGMEHFTVELGQFVRMGESVAVMGLGPNRASSDEAATPKSILYVEFRKDGNSIDPGPWWLATDNQKARG